MSDAVQPQIVSRSVAYTGYLTVEKLHIKTARSLLGGTLTQIVLPLDPK